MKGKALLVSLLVVAAGLAPLAMSATKAEAQVRRGFNRGMNFNRNRVFNNNFRSNRIMNDRFIRSDRFFRSQPFISRERFFRTDRDFLFRRGFSRHNFPVRVISNRDFFFREGLFNRFPVFNRTFPDFVEPREFVIIDRGNLDNFIVVQNTLTGPFSVNRAFITVDSGFFDQFATDFQSSQNVSISVDTGNNVVTMNTITGPISTGDVDINIQ